MRNVTLPQFSTVFSEPIDSKLAKFPPITLGVLDSDPSIKDVTANEPNASNANVALTVWYMNDKQFRIAATNLCTKPFTKLIVQWWALG